MANTSSVRVELQHATAMLALVSRQPSFDAALLLCRALGKDRAWLLAHGDEPLAPSQLEAFEKLLARRRLHEPIQYILGEQEFFGLPLRVTPSVLIPRPETEHLVEAVLARLPTGHALRIADVGTGSGAIALALAHSLPLAMIDALDLSTDALAIARENAAALGLSERLRFLHSDLLAAVAGQSYDCIVSNPPYVAVTDTVDTTDTLEPQVMLWEPHAALFAGKDGLDVYRRLLPEAAALLVPGGLLALELGAGQSDALAALFAADPRWTGLTFFPDLRGIPRVAVAVSQP